ncbi:MAG: hypothetical protein IJQ11_15095 [Bacteroidales bacterium]|nr:hypothetical protein [Bacteroidales bacterium]
METTRIANLANHELPELKRRGIFRRWYYTPTQMPVRKKEYYFTDDVEDVKALLEGHRFNDVKELHCKTLSPSGLLVVSTNDGRFAAAQVRKYEPYEFKPVSEIMVFYDTDAEVLLTNLKELKPDEKYF